MTREELLKVSKPVLFNGDMVLGILDGRKTVTRRAIKPQPTNDIQCPLGYCVDGGRNEIGKFAFGSHASGGKMIFCKPPYRPGDILYVRETWSDHYVPDEEGKAKLEYCYKADGTDIKGECLPGENNRWYPSIHMPKKAARIFLKVTDVRVERLQDITEYQIVAEGTPYDKEDYEQWRRGDKVTHNAETYLRGYFRELWNSTIKKSDLDRYGWEANPWVWVIEFKRCKKPEREG